MYVIFKEKQTKQYRSMQDTKKYQAFTVVFCPDHKCVLYIGGLIFRNILNTYKVQWI